jgi:hypothetical protein
MEAVHHLSGPCLVLAGAGSGKTRVIVHKIAHLLQGGLSAERIAAITFTNKAAAEMRERTRAMAGARAAKALVICTFHALGVRMLREHGELLGLKPRFSILDSDDVLAVMRDAGGTSDAALARRWQWTISGWKNQGLTAQAAEAAAGSDDEQVAARVMRRYEERLSAYQSVDFDDLIGLPLKLLREHDDARAAWQERFAHVLIDEVQDTNAVQYELLKTLVGERAPFTAVGDDDQSIYGWRGAEVENILRFERDFPGAKVIRLERNYRSTGHILAAASHLIAHNEGRLGKTLRTEDVDGEKVTTHLGVPRFRPSMAEEQNEIGVATGLAWTEVGGELLVTEATLMAGKGKLTLTGKLGDVMQESAQAALSYVRSKAAELNLADDFHSKIDIHVHVPEGAIPKDGPSAGITMATTLVSALTRIPTRREVAMTGEITLRGKVLPIGGVKEKILAAHRAGVTNIVLPRDNEKDLADIPKNVMDSLDIHMVSTMDEVLKIALAQPLPARIPAPPVVAEVTEPAGDTRPH